MLSRKIVNDNQVIAVENLNVKAMVKNPKLSKAISQVGWGMFCTMLKYKAEREGKVYVEVGRFFPSSKTCNHCLHKVEEMPLNIRAWTCPKCKAHHDRDVNAACNIRDEGLRLLRGRNSDVSSECKTLSACSLGTSDTASGDSVRPKRRVTSNPRLLSVREEAP